MENNKFDIKVKEDHGDTYLSITHDGNQWTSMRITGKIPHLIEVLELHLTKQSSGREKVEAICKHGVVGKCSLCKNSEKWLQSSR